MKVKKYKKILGIVLYTAVIAIAAFLISSALMPRDNIVFEMIRDDQSNGTPPDKGLYWGDTYFALLDDNSLVWIYGQGQMTSGRTYASFFMDIQETGNVTLTDAEAKKLESHMKKLIKNYKEVPYDYYWDLHDHDGIDRTLKHNGKYYNAYAKKNNTPDEISFYTLELEITELISGYREKYKDDIDEFTFMQGGHKYYAYQELQKQRDKENN